MGKRIVWAALAVAGLATGCVSAVQPPAGVARAGTVVGEAETAQALGRALAKLGDGGEVQVEREADGFKVETPAAPLELGSGLVGTARTPRPEEIDAAFGQYCRLRGRPERERRDGFTRLTYRGVARRSSAECTLIADLPKEGKWRFVLRIRRHTDAS